MLSLLLAVISSACISLVFKALRSGEGNSYGVIIGNYLTCILISFFMIGSLPSVLTASAPTVECGIAGGVLYVLGLVFLQGSISENGAALTSAFSKLGLLIPLTLSFAVFGEKPGPFQLLGILLVLIALTVINLPSGSGDKRGSSRPASALLLFLTFLGNGAADSMAKVYEQVGSRDEDRIYIFFIFTAACILSLLLSYAEYKKTGRALIKKELLAGIAVGVPNYFSSYFLLSSLEKLPSFIVYPIFSTGTILLVMSVSVLFFKERLNRKQYIALSVILAALVLLNI